MSGKKFDEGKLRFDLIPPEAEEALARVLTMGAAKYGDRNWEEGIKFSRLYAAMRRHLNSHRTGEVLDPESGLPHLDHALANLAMMVTFQSRGRVELDDISSSTAKQAQLSLPLMSTRVLNRIAPLGGG